ncbi:hypothetical protein B0O99DRAFT_591533 [Bisporella sp. PMI_857]|nr:hypothetical protein B0O99DRAFT_591533 [Bisporella sp. PMI_857]
MVGVAGKSKACKECKRRRVKCGLERPRCLRCTKAKIRCSGYGNDIIFVNRTQQDPSTTASLVITSVKQASLARQESDTEPSMKTQLGMLTELLHDPFESGPRYRAIAFDILRKLYLPQPGPNEDVASARCSSWVGAVCAPGGICLTLDHALLAFCTTMVYVTQTGDTSLEQALEVYNDALSRLSRELQHDQSTGEEIDRLLAAIVVLSVCELFICSSDESWCTHVQGIAQILRLKGQYEVPTSPSYGWSRLCSRLRVMTGITELAKRRKSSLTNDQWRAVMSAKIDLDPFDELIDIASDLPVLFEEADMLVASKDLSSRRNTAILTAMANTAANLYSWQRKHCSQFSRQIYQAVPSRLHNPSDDRYGNNLYPFVLQFASLDVASYFTLSWGILLQTLASILRFLNEVPGSNIYSPAIDELSSNFTSQMKDSHILEGYVHNPTSSIRLEADKLARYLCLSIEYCHRIDMGALGHQATTYSQWIIRSYYEDVGAERELTWCLNINKMTGPGSSFLSLPTINLADRMPATTMSARAVNISSTADITPEEHRDRIYIAVLRNSAQAIVSELGRKKVYETM